MKFHSAPFFELVVSGKHQNPLWKLFTRITTTKFCHQCLHALPFYFKGNLTNKSTIDQLHRAVAQGCPFLCRPGGDFRALSLVESPDLEEPEVTQEEVSTLGREQLHFWSSFLRRSFIFCSTVALIYAAVYSCAPQGSAACRPCCGSGALLWEIAGQKGG